MPRYRSDCAGRARDSCLAEGARCRVVRRSSRAREHCRIRRGATSRSATSRSARLRRARDELRRRSRELAPRCGDFSLVQRGNTCYLSSATLVVGRTLLPYVRDEAVRRHVRLTIANRWDDAQGDVTEATCPRIPTEVRQIYANLEKHVNAYLDDPDANYRARHLDRRSLTCARDRTCPTQAFTSGGFAAPFLVALLWAGRVRCRYTMHCLWYRRPSTELRHYPEGTAPIAAVRRTLSKIDPSIPFHVVEFSSPLEYSADTSVLAELLEEGYAHLRNRRHATLAVLLDLVNSDGTRAHTVTLFPCLRGRTLHWTLCNTWRPRCQSDLWAALRALEAERGYRQVTGLTFVVHAAR